MKEDDLLRGFAKVVGAEKQLDEMEKKRQKEQRMLAGLSAKFGTTLKEDTAKRKVPLSLVKQPQYEQDDGPLTELQIEQIKESVIPPMPELPIDTIVTQAVQQISKAPPSKEQAAVDQIPDALRREIDALKKTVTDLHSFARRASQMGGGGEVNLRYLDDVARNTIDDGLFLKYQSSSKKFVFAPVNATALITNVTYVTGDEYTVQDEDYYIGVDYAGPTTIILPTESVAGRCLVIKDEDGDAETNPITVQGTVDNDAGGFVLALDNGSIQLIYRNGWRII
jgi:hypothetical protein